MDHGSAVKLGADHASEKKAKLGIKMFIVYTVVYAIFVAIGIADYESLSIIVFAGLNLALVYGFGLIAFAIVLGIIYSRVCTNYENKMNKEDKK